MSIAEAPQSLVETDSEATQDSVAAARALQEEIAAKILEAVTVLKNAASKVVINENPDGVSTSVILTPDSVDQYASRKELGDGINVIQATFHAAQKITKSPALSSLRFLGSKTKMMLHDYGDGRSEQRVDVSLQCKDPEDNVVELQGFAKTEVRATLNAIQSHLQGKKPHQHSL